MDRNESLEAGRALSARALVAALALGGALAGGCEAADALPGADVEGAQEPEGEDTTTAEPDATDAVEEELLPLPILVVTIEASTLSGNAPLHVSFEAIPEVLEAHSHAEVLEGLTYDWTIGQSVTYEGETIEHDFYVAGSTEVCVTLGWKADDGREAIATGCVKVKITGCADLGFTKVSIAPPVEVAPGESMTFLQAALTNDGDVIESPFEVHVLLSKDDIFDPDGDRIIDARSFDGMDAGLFQDVSIDLTSDPVLIPEDVEEGSYFVFLVADPELAINECTETNNVAKSTNNLGVDAGVAFKPDLVVEDVSYPCGLVKNQGENLNYSFVVKNVGEGEASQFRIAVWLSVDDVLDPEEDLMMSGPDDLGSKINELAVQQSQSFFKSWTVPEDLPDGDYQVLVVVDAKDQVLELDEDNNVSVSGCPFTTEFSKPQCFDLDFVELIVSPKTTYWNGSVGMKVVLQNPGTQQVPAGVPIKVLFSQQKALNPSLSTPMGTFLTGAPIPPGGELVVEEIIKIPKELPVKDWYAGVLIDPDNTFTECTEINNAKVFDDPIKVVATANVDLGCEEVEFHPNLLNAGEDLKLSYQMTNTGSSAATAFKVFVVFSEDPSITMSSAQSGQDPLVKEVVISSVEAATDVELVEKVPVPLALDHTVDTWYVGIVADPTGSQGSDKNKANNVCIAPEPLTVLGPLGGCFEDALEPNNNKNQAVQLGAGLTEGLGSCGNEDWYAISVPEGFSLTVDAWLHDILSLDPISSDLDIALYGPDGKVVDSSKNAGDVETVQVFTVAEAGTWLLEVFPKKAGVLARYDLDVKVSAPVDGVDLLPANVVALPSPLYPGGLIQIDWADVNLGVSDAPGYVARIWASKDAVLDPAPGAVECATLPDDNLADRCLISVPLVGLSAQSQTIRSMQLVLPDDLPGGTWRFIVQLNPDGAVLEADLDNNVSSSDTIFLDAQLTCADDDLEPNNAPPLATPLELDEGFLSLSGMTVCPKLDDWYSVDLAEGQAFTATVQYDYKPTKGLVTLELWDPTGETVYAFQTAQSTSQINLPWIWSSGTYLLRVGNLAQGSNEAPYSYTLAVAAVTGSLIDQCDADAFEDNASFSQASSIGCGLQRATMCKGDVDVYRLEVEALGTVTVTLEHPEAQLKMALYEDPKGTSVASKGTNGSVTYFAEVDTTIWLKVESKVPAGELASFDYSLFMDGLHGVDLSVRDVELYFPEVFQGDDQLVSFGVENTCIDATESFAVTLWLSQDEVLDDDDVDLEQVTLPGLAPKTVADLDEKVVIPYSAAPGDYFLIVEADSTGLVAESNEANNSGSAPQVVAELCLPDGQEPNDFVLSSPQWAPEAAPPGYAGLALCPYDVDWFQVDVPPGEEASVTLWFDHEEGDLDLRLYDPGYSTTIPVMTGASMEDGEEASYAPPAGGPVLVRINGFDGASAAYDLSVAVQ